MNDYLSDFGETFFSQVKILIDNAVQIKNEKEAIAIDVYKNVGLLKKNYTSYNHNNKNDALNEFKLLFRELNLQIEQYKQETSRFFGRDNLFEKVCYKFNCFTS